uniref:Uncharacterized protein n=1 Tax=Ciona savignyi TaxID=51511 RepID=H2YKX1_CIOSA
MLLLEINELSEDMTSHTAHQRFLLTQLDELQSRFGEAWTECIEMEKASSDQDKEILGGISKVQRDTKERSETLNGISTHLKNELETLTGFVENVSNRRPKDTRQSKRRSMAPPSDSRIVQTPAILRKRRNSGPSVVNPVGTF